MSERNLGSIHMECDSPHEAVVAGCALGEFIRPGDVAWRKAPVLGPNRCKCGRYCGEMEQYEFEFNDGHHETYKLLQCPKCLTIHWRRTQVRVPVAA
jgi:hypothetical protein